MSELLEKAYKEAKMASPEVQDMIATLILAELESEIAWQKSFDATTDEQWDRMTESVRKEIASGTTEPLDDLLK